MKIVTARFLAMSTFLAGCFVLFYGELNAQTTNQLLLYKNDFNTPKTGETIQQFGAYYDLDEHDLNVHFGGTGQSDAGFGNVYFSNTFTVETLMNNGNGTNPEVYKTKNAANFSKHGLYSIGMQSGQGLYSNRQGSGAEDDRVAFKLRIPTTTPNGTLLNFVNVSLDISTIALQNIDGNHQFPNTGNGAPKFEVKAYNAPNFTETSAVFGANNTTVVTGSQFGPTTTITGNPVTESYTYNWKTVIFSINLTAVTTRNIGGTNYREIVVVLDLLDQQYAALDNLLITADEVSLPVVFGSINASIKSNNLSINWQTETETGNSHFDVMASTDGARFTKIGTVNSKALNGNSGVAINYEFSTPLRSAAGIMGLTFAMLGILASLKNRKLAMLLLVVGISSFAVSCSKNETTAAIETNQPVFVKIVQVDIDGKSEASSIVRAIYE